MTTVHEAQLMTRLYNMVVKRGHINRYDLEDECRISSASLDKIKGKLLHRYRVGNGFKQPLKYDSSSKEFSVLEVGKD